jgi:hypothetical protein
MRREKKIRKNNKRKKKTSKERERRSKTKIIAVHEILMDVLEMRIRNRDEQSKRKREK